MPAVEVSNLERTYTGSRGWHRRERTVVRAVAGISFEVQPGELFGLLGPNGAGKTTTFKVLTTLLLPTAGNARVLGLDVVTDAQAIRRRIGCVFGGDRGFYERLSARDNLRYFAELYDVEPRARPGRIATLFELVGLAGLERERVEAYSRGMRQRLHIARALLNRPEVLFLDEPTLGVDPIAARDLRATVAELARAGTSVLLTTHYMFEADELCNRIAVIVDGQIQASGSPDQLKTWVRNRRVLEIRVYGIRAGQVASIKALPGVQTVSTETQGQAQLLMIQMSARADAMDVRGRVLSELGGVRVGGLTLREPSLEDAYVTIVTDSAHQPVRMTADPGSHWLGAAP